MPATTSLEAMGFLNAGPLTTTFTAPSSCETTDMFWGQEVLAIDHTDLGYRRLANVGGCALSEWATYGSCYPHGDKLDEIATSAPWSTPYYYPASICPSGYQTVGIAAMSSGSASVSGIFTANLDEVDEARYGSAPHTEPPVNWVPNRLTLALGPEETIIACCPSGYTIIGFDPECHSTIPVSSLAGETGCAGIPNDSFAATATGLVSTETWSYNGATYTNTVQSPLEPFNTEHMSITTYTFDEQGVPTAYLDDLFEDLGMGDYYEPVNGSEHVGGVHVAVMYLFHDGAGSNETSSKTGTGTETGADAEETGEPSAGSALAPANLWRAVGGVMALWTVGAIAGVGIMAAL